MRAIILPWRLAITVSVSLVIGLLLVFLFWQREPKFSISYVNSELDGKEIVLAKSIDPTKRQLEMFIDPNYPSTFTIVGISARNDSTVPLQPDMIYLSFSSPVSIMSLFGGGWLPSPDRNIAGWTTFQTFFPTITINPQHPLNIPNFVGTPLPKTAVEIRLTLVYGSVETSAEFTLKP